MQNGNVQEGFDYILGQLHGLQAACAVAFGYFASASGKDLEDLREILQEIADYTVAIDVQGDLQGVSREHRGPFYEGIRYSIEQITQRFAAAQESGGESEPRPSD